MCSGAYDDEAALARFAAQVDVITYEFENVPEAAVAECQRTSRCGRACKPIHVAQHRLREKEFFRKLGIGTADYQPITQRGRHRRSHGTARHPEDLHRGL